MAVKKRSRTRRSKKPKRSLVKAMPLALAAQDNTPLIVFPGEVIHSFRHTITRQARSGTLPKRIAMTSSIREEGVTYTSLAMATTIANDLRLNVCVVELNWWWPGMNRELTKLEKQQPSAPIRVHKQNNGLNALNGNSQVVNPVDSLGVAGILKKQTTLEEALITTSLPNLRLLPAGRLNVEQRPIAARSAELNQLLREIDQHFDLLVIDTPPVLVTSDAIALVSLGTACYLVVQQGVTSIENVRTTLDDISHMEVGGVILNQVKVHTPDALMKLVAQI